MFSAPGDDKPADAPVRNPANQVVTLRKCWGLSQKQFADLFMTTARTVKRWEAACSRMTPHQRFFLGVFARYVGRYGAAAFRRRVRAAGRAVWKGRTAQSGMHIRRVYMKPKQQVRALRTLHVCLQPGLARNFLPIPSFTFFHLLSHGLVKKVP